MINVIASTSTIHTMNFSGLPLITIVVLALMAVITGKAIYANEKRSIILLKPAHKDDIAREETNEVAQTLLDIQPMKIELGYVGNEALKKKQKEHLEYLKAFVSNKAKKEDEEWQHIRSHTSHIHSGFDWWMVPINRSSDGYGKQYQVSQEDAELLLKDEQFVANYREGVLLIAASWGWDLGTKTYITSKEKYWSGYQVRLGKMLNSLIVFQQKDLHSALVYFIENEIINKEAPKDKQVLLKSQLETWIPQYLTYSGLNFG